MNKLKRRNYCKYVYKPERWFCFVLVVLINQVFYFSNVPQSDATPKTTYPSGKLHKSSKQKSILEAILAIISKKKIPGSSRTTGQFCPIAPAVIEAKNVIWSDRPLFSWRGTISSLQVRPYVSDGVFSDQSLVWEPTTEELGQGFINPPISLKPGQRYDWQVIYASAGVEKPTKVRRTYQVMASPERDRIAQALQALEAQLKSEGATENEVKLARAQYFLERDLWSDALQQIYPMRNNGPEFLELLRAVGDRACKPESMAQVR